jgi:DNA polymerase III alpha subunit
MAGAFDSLNKNRKAIFEAIPEIISFGQNVRELADNDTASLFGEEELQETIIEPKIPMVLDWNREERFKNELDVTGFYISNHPMTAFEIEERAFSFTSSIDNYELINEKIVGVCGVINGLETKISNNGSTFANFIVNGLNGMFECTMWARSYEKYLNMINDGAVLYLSGKAELSGDSVKIMVDAAMPIEQCVERFTRRIKFTIDPAKTSLTDLEKIHQIVMENPGNIDLFFEYLQIVESGIKPRIFRCSFKKMRVNRDIIAKLGKLIGEDNLAVER